MEQSIYANRDYGLPLTDLTNEELCSKIEEVISNFGDGVCEFETREIEQLLKLVTLPAVPVSVKDFDSIMLMEELESRGINTIKLKS